MRASLTDEQRDRLRRAEAVTVEPGESGPRQERWFRLRRMASATSAVAGAIFCGVVTVRDGLDATWLFFSIVMTAVAIVLWLDLVLVTRAPLVRESVVVLECTPDERRLALGFWIVVANAAGERRKLHGDMAAGVVRTGDVLATLTRRNELWAFERVD